MSDLEIVPASRFARAAVADLMNRGYADYYTPILLDEPAFAEMVHLQDIALEESPVAVRDGAPAGVALVALRGDRAWIGGLAVPPEARRQGLGRRLVRAAIERAAARGARSVDLEVLVQNAPAIPLYLALGFRDTRMLGVFVRRADEATRGAEAGAGRAAEAALAECLAGVASDGPLAAPWQRARPVIERSAPGCVALGVRDASGLAACAILRAQPGRTSILHLGARPDARDEDLGELVEAIVARHGAGAILMLNHPEGNAVERALLAAGFGVSFRQREMRLTF